MTPTGPAFRGGSGPPLVLLHGLFMSWHAWQPVLAGLQAHHEVLAPTLAGHRGGPAWPAGRIGIGPLVEAVEERMDAAGWERAHVVGNSLGGWLALELARRGRASSVVAFSPAGTWTGRPSYHLLLAKLRLIAGISRLPGAARLSPLLADARACTALPPLVRWMEQHGPMAPFDVGGVPTRIAWPLHDRTIPWRHHGVVFRTLVPGAELVRLRGVGHVPMTDDPSLVARTILQVTSP
ncbi:alpha/beta fold hydrolase [Nocardioides aromaticivorans]|nr:alpha/beta fold hydrolase [Nocardioides aromaticivorans]